MRVRERRERKRDSVLRETDSGRRELGESVCERERERGGERVCV